MSYWLMVWLNLGGCLDTLFCLLHIVFMSQN